jgi:rhodanese-related sulfurtransferase
MLEFLKKLFGGVSVNFKELITKGAIIVDVRSNSEYKAGHIPGSKNFPLDTNLINPSSQFAGVDPEVEWQKAY